MKVLIADDEMQIRTGLEQGIDWKEIGISEVLTADNGVAALELARVHQPEIVLTDIRMPGIDGLELSRQLAKLYEPLKIIIMSGYSEFNYAREAIKIGVMDYLIKPICIEELMEKVQSAEAFITEQIHEGKYKLDYLEKNKEKQLIKFVTLSILPDTDIDEFLRTYTRLELSNKVFMGCISLDKLSLNLWNQVFIYLTNYLEGSLFALKAAVLYSKDSQILFLAEAFTNQEMTHKMGKLSAYFGELNRMLENQYQVTVSVFFSECAACIELPVLYEQCLEAGKHRLYTGKESFLEYSKLKEGTKQGYVNFNEGSLKEQIKLFSYEKAMEYVQKEFYRLKEERVISESMIKELCIRFKNSMVSTLMEKGIDIESMFGYNISLLTEIPECISIDEYLAWVDNLYYLVLQGVIQLEGKNHSRLTVQAVNYISQNYNQNIDLESVAEYVNKSKNYFSYLFKKELGISFVEYLNQVRIENAKILLTSSAKMTYEIAEEVGYSDYKYFCSVFKKYTGASPGQYRKA